MCVFRAFAGSEKKEKERKKERKSKNKTHCDYMRKHDSDFKIFN